MNCCLIRLKEHVDDPDKLPILIFPEGTCINNTSVMQFKKGSFEVGSVVYPVAIKVFTSSSFFKICIIIFFFRHLVRCTVYRCFLEFKSSFYDPVFIHDDVLLGLSLRCLVPTPYASPSWRECNWFCQSSQSRHCKTGWLGRSVLVSLSKTKTNALIELVYVIFFGLGVLRDGALKRMNAKKEWKQKQQEEFSKRLKVEWWRTFNLMHV